MSSRLPALDAVRGVALLGILVVNLSAFTLPLAASGLPDPTDAVDLLAWIPIKWAFETKFMVLFSLLFGMGAALQSMGAARRGQAFAPLWRRRMAVLALVGALHAWLVWSGDILLHYAIVGLFVPPLLGLSRRVLWPLIVALIGLPWMINVVGHAVLASLPGAEGPAIEIASGLPWVDAMFSAGLDPRAAAFQQAELHVWERGTLLDVLLLRGATWAGFQTVLLLTLQPLRTLGIFLLGAQLWKLGLFRDEGRGLRRRLITWGLGAGLAVEGLVVLAHLLAGLNEASPLAVVAEALHGLSGLAVGLGLAGGLAAVGLHPVVGKLLTPLARAGRMALTSYLGHSIAGLVLVGLVGFGVVHRVWHLPIALVIVAAQVGLALFWLSRFRMGPVEWAWRALTHGRLPPFLGAAR